MSRAREDRHAAPKRILGHEIKVLRTRTPAQKPRPARSQARRSREEPGSLCSPYPKTMDKILSAHSRPGHRFRGDVANGSFADIPMWSVHVRPGLRSRHQTCEPACPLRPHADITEHRLRTSTRRSRCARRQVALR